MSKSFALACASHTPLLMDERYASAAVCAEVKRKFMVLADFIREFAPDDIVQFSPDHYHGFHYDVMPSFCVGAAATSYGDYGTKKGPLKVDEDFALALLEAARENDIDAALSFDMIVDHGFVQIWEIMFGRFDDQPIVPVFVNAIGHPLPKYRRARIFGDTIGRFAAGTGKRVLFVASGGLSHDPLVPVIRGASPELRNRLVGRSTDPDQQSKREKAVHAAAALAMKGEGPSRPLNPDWDRRFLQMLHRRDWAAIDRLTPESVQLDAGGGGNEVLAWVAAAAAMSAAGGGTYEVVQEDYLAIPGWIAGLGIMSAH